MSINISTGSDQINQNQRIDSQQTNNTIQANNALPFNSPEPKMAQKGIEKRLVFCGLEQLPEGNIIKGDKLGQGGGGTVYQGILTDEIGKKTIVVVKMPLKGKKDSEEGIKHELEISESITKKSQTSLQDPQNLISNQEALILMSLPCKIDGNNVQRFIHGKDGAQTIRNKPAIVDLYRTPLGNPNNISQAINLARELLACIHSLHQQGFVHGDMKLENIIISVDNSGIPHCYIIDFGTSGEKEKDKIASFSSNCAPEVSYESPLLPNQDIYATGGMICELLFGAREKNYKTAKGNMNFNQWFAAFDWQNAGKPQDFANCYAYKNKKTKKATKYLKRLLREANQLEGGITLYPPAIYKAIEDLIVRMCAINPKDRPSSQYCLAVLNDIALCAEAMQKGIKIEKPMITGTLTQAIQLISDLNELNNKTKLTSEEKSTKEVLIYNLQRDFEISPENKKLKLCMQKAITNVTNGKVLTQEILKKLNNKCKNDIQLQILSTLKAKLTGINSSNTQEIITNIETQLQKAKKGDMIEQSTLNKIRIDIEKDIQLHSLLELQNKLENLDAENKKTNRRQNRTSFAAIAKRRKTSIK